MEAKQQNIVFRSEESDGKGEGDDFDKKMVVDVFPYEEPVMQLDFGGRSEEDHSELSSYQGQHSFSNKRKLKVSGTLCQEDVFGKSQNHNDSFMLQPNTFVDTKSTGGQKITMFQTVDQERWVGKGKENHRYEDIADQASFQNAGLKVRQVSKDKFDASNISKGLFNGENEWKKDDNYSGSIPASQKVAESGQPQQQKQKSTLVKKLPPLKKKQSSYTEQNVPNQSLVSGGNQSSMVFLNKNITETSPKKIGKEKGQIQILEEDDTPALAFRSIPVWDRVVGSVQRKKGCWMSYSNPVFTLNDESGRFVLEGKKEWGNINSHYNITCQEGNYNSENEAHAGYLKGNFNGSYFNLFRKSREQEQLVAAIHYKIELSCRSSRSIQIYIRNDRFSMDAIEGSNQTRDLKQLYQNESNVEGKKIFKLVNKQPEWRQKHGCFVLDFRGKSKYPSVKNMILIEEGEQNRESLLFCKTDKDEFRMEVGFPLNSYIAFGVVLSCFDFKLLCQ